MGFPFLTSINRDDPSLDENTRLRNRIAELESLVRELRGRQEKKSIIFSIDSSKNFQVNHIPDGQIATSVMVIPTKSGILELQNAYHLRNGGLSLNRHNSLSKMASTLPKAERTVVLMVQAATLEMVCLLEGCSPC